MTDTFGGFDERGYLNNFTRRGFTPPRCILELHANSLDALTAAGRTDDGKITYSEGQHTTIISDNGAGMDRPTIRNMFALHRENHANDHSRGVSGIGAKPALSILSEKRHVKIYTRKHGNDYLCVDVPWDRIHCEGRYTDMVTSRPMTDEEIAAFGSIVGGDTGTVIEIPNSDLLTKAIRASLNKETLPLDRIPVVFGRDCATVSYKHFESAEPEVFPKYNYFAGPSSGFYTGVSVDTINLYYDPRTKDCRYIWDDNGTQKECIKDGRGIAKVPTVSTRGLGGWILVGPITVYVGLRRDPVIFNDDAPALPDASEKMDAYTRDVVGDHREFNSKIKLVRNWQTIGTFQMPDVTGESARASGFAYLHSRLLQCEVHYSPLSTHDNHMDREMQIQENKNQHHGAALSLQFTRTVKAIRMKKAKQIWDYFEERVSAAAPAPVPAAALSHEVSPSPAPSPSSTASLSPVLVAAPSPTLTASLSPFLAPAPAAPALVEQIESLPPPQPVELIEVVAPLPADSVSGAELQLLMTASREKLTLATEYSDPIHLRLRDALREFLE
jgi:hypothetical protein